MKLLDKYKLPEESIVFVKVIVSIVLFFTLIPLGSFVLWNLIPSRPLGVVVLDKTVSNSNTQEHYAIHWILNHLKYTKAKGGKYDSQKDYFGFFPKKTYKESHVKDFENLTSEQKSQLVAQNDVFYFSDTYGIYKSDFSELKENKSVSEMLYGGLTYADLDVLEKAIQKERIIIAEFNTINSPTPKKQRLRFEELTEIRWTGWITRYFDELDTLLNDELPSWMIEQYKIQHQGEWEFKGSGMVFLNENGRIEVLSYEKDTKRKMPAIISPLTSQQNYNIPEVSSYPYWIDIVLVSRDFDVVSYYDLSPTDEGLEKLRSMGLPRYFPAVVTRKIGENGKLYYFSGDFADNPVQDSSHKFFGIARLWKMFLGAEDLSNRNSFFWNYYFPLLKEILSEAKNRN